MCAVRRKTRMTPKFWASVTVEWRLNKKQVKIKRMKKSLGRDTNSHPCGNSQQTVGYTSMHSGKRSRVDFNIGALS